MPSLIPVPISIAEANAFVEEHHRHSGRVQGAKFAIGAGAPNHLFVGEIRICGVGLVGRPLARPLQDAWTAEALRVCTDGTPNACSFLYGACWRAARAMGYRRLITYTLQSEPGSSLRAAGFRVVGEVRSRSWHTPSRPRVDKHDGQARLRWEVALDA